MELLQLKYFCDAAVTQNFSETARKFSVPTSNISNAIKRLEREFGCNFFDHFSNKISLNEKGRILYEKASAALYLLDDARVIINEDEKHLSGEIHLRCKSNRGIVTKAMEKFIAVHPEVKFSMTFGEAPMKDVDILITYTLPIDAKEKILILEEDLLIAMRKDHPLSGKKNLQIADLKNERFIVGLATQTDEECKRAGFIPNITFELNDPAYVRKYIEMGLGIAFIPSVSWSGLFSENIVLKNVGVKRHTYAYIPNNKYTKKSVEVFMKFLIDEAKEAVMKLGTEGAED